MSPLDCGTRRVNALARSHVLTAAVVLAGLVAGAPAAAQDPVPGDMIRIGTGGAKGVYELREIRDDTLFAATRAGVVIGVPVASVRTLEVGTPEGRGVNMLRRTAIGLLVGGAVGWIIGSSTQKGPTPRCVDIFWFRSCPEPDSYGDEGATWGALLGGTAGLVSGAVTPSWRWHPVPTARLAVRVAPGPGGVGLALSWQP